jgi:hypothetical protein
MTDHVARVFSIIPGRCFRYVKGDAESSIPCPEPVVVLGRWRDTSGRLRWVEACGLHVGELDEIEAEGQQSVRSHRMGIETDWNG